ncbi:glycoside hydrolase superfamily [Phlyctochytrium arcticum]|nr:glycoside hydrolase superfamily [Phlyctochytrium arcticum]
MANSFVTRVGVELVENNTSLRFLSFNTPTLHLHDDPEFIVPTPYEQDDVLSSIQQLGGRVVRTYTLAIQKPSEAASTDTTKHIIKLNGKISLNDRVFRALDNALALAGQRNIKVIIPLVDRLEFWGGTGSFAQLVDSRKSEASFYTDPSVRDAFKDVIQQVLSRVNTVNNITYKDDPAILAWETGNELEFEGKRVPGEWTSDIAKYIKSIDPNHLVVDGSWKHGWDDSVLNDPNIDIYSNHYYRSIDFSVGESVGLGIAALVMLSSLIVLVLASCFPNALRYLRHGQSKSSTMRRRRILRFVTIGVALAGIVGSVTGITLMVVDRHSNPRYGAWTEQDASIINSHKKVFITGEYGLASTKSMAEVMERVISKTPSMAGALLWSLRGHANSGGFYVHSELHGYNSYHHPGFPAAPGFGEDEQDVMNLAKSNSGKLATSLGFALPAPTVPIAPVLLNATKPNLTWRGSAGADRYDIERSDGANSDAFKVIAAGVLDNKKLGSVLFSDTQVTPGTTCRYRIKARNAVGTGDPSNIIDITI